MTPMIDVTFLLLVFFLCTLQFNELKLRHEINLPKDMGCHPGLDDLERCDIIVRKIKGNRLSYSIGSERYFDLADMRQRLDAFPLETTVTIDMREGTINQEFMDVFDQVIDRGFKKINVAASLELN